MKELGKRIVFGLERRNLFNWMPDKMYLKLMFRAQMNRKLNLKKPITYNEKLQWLKLYNRNPEYTTYVDKYAVREYIKKTIGEEYLIPLLGVWDKPDDIDFNALPDKFVLKCNHNSGKGMCICKDKADLDIEKVKSELREGLSQNYYKKGREWPYKNVKPKIVAETYMEDNETAELRDYKFFCFDGKAESIFIATDRQNKSEETKFDFFDMEFNFLPFTNGHPNAKTTPKKPLCFDEMRTLAEKLSKDIPHVRVDFYEVNGKVYFGEMTFYHWSGMVPFNPDEWDFKWGNMIKLPKV